MCELISSHCNASDCEAQRGQIYPEPGPALVAFISQHIVMHQSREWGSGSSRDQWETGIMGRLCYHMDDNSLNLTSNHTTSL